MNPEVRYDSLSIPVVIDDVKKFPSFAMSRCNYFSIECDEPSVVSFEELGTPSITFLSVGLSGVLFGPSLEDREFDGTEKIESLFNSVEEDAGCFVELNDIWLPNKMFGDRDPVRGDVYRVSQELFIV